MYRKKTLRQMQPTTRKLARLANELDSIHRRLTNTLQEIGQMEADSTALRNMSRARHNPADNASGTLFDEEEQ